MKVSKSLEIWDEIIPKDESENVFVPMDTSSIFQGKSFTPKLRELFNFQIAPGIFRYDTQLQVAQSNQAPPIVKIRYFSIL